jgi:adenylate cyclase
MPSARPQGVVLSARQRLVAALATGLGVALLLVLARGADVVERIELSAIDARTRGFAGERGPDPRIVLAQVLEEDVERLREVAQPWPWDLALNAQAVRLMKAAGAKAIAIDVYHLDKGAGPDDVFQSERLAADVLQTLEGEAMSADDYGSALKEHGASVVAFDLATDAGLEMEPRRKAAESRLGPAGLVAPPSAHARAHAHLPVRRVAEGATILAFANVDPDVDGMVRRALTLARWGDRTVMSLPLATASLVTGETPRFEEGAVTLGGTRTRLHPDGSFLVDFRAKQRNAYPRVPPFQILKWGDELRGTQKVPDAARAALGGKIVIWGVNLAGILDVTRAPIDGKMEGPEFQATVLDDLLNGGGRVRAPFLANAALLFAAALLTALGGWLLGGRVLPHLAALAALAIVAVVTHLAFAAGTSLDLFTPLLGVFLAWGGVTLTRLLTEGRYNRWLEGAFGRYLAPSVIDALKNDPSLLELGGRRREITVLFSDVAGFTTLSKQLGEKDIVRLLNEYLTTHCDAVFEEGGVVDKFIGDAVMAFWGDPIPTDDHAVRACRSALSVQARMPALEPLWRSMGVADFRVRIGLNSGVAVVGNMGSRQRFDYTCMGDTVNLASRLEGANKKFHTSILLGSRTHAEAKDAILARPLAGLTVVGRDEPEPVYELLAMRESAPKDLVAHVDAFVAAQAAAARDDLPAAEAALAEAERLRPGDGPTAWFRDVLVGLRAGKTPRPWSGVLTLTEK